MKNLQIPILLCAGLLFAACEPTPQAVIRVDAAQVLNPVTPWLYGACMEDVNHEIYGGLYDQRIFGESYEEPVPSPVFEDFESFDGLWKAAGGVLHVDAHSGAKLVSKTADTNNGLVETELRILRGGSGDNAALLVRVSKPGRGADNFYGYEIGLAADGRKVVMGKHKNNFELLANADVACDPKEWNRLAVETNADSILVFLNGRRVLAVAEKDAQVNGGQVALRTWNADAQFRSLKAGATGNPVVLEFRTTPQLPVSRMWSPYTSGDAVVVYKHLSNDAFNGACSQEVEFVSGKGAVGISNAGLNRWGIAVGKGQKFEGRLYLKGFGLQGPVRVALQNADGSEEYASARIDGVGSEWAKYPFDLTSGGDDANARFVVYLDAPGRIRIDQVTLMSTGKTRFHGLPMRNDIGQAMVEQGLTFLRYGGTMINAPEYRFKKMIGDRDKRPPYRGHWYRYSTNGFGIEEFLQFCEAAGFEPSFAVNIEETPQDMADMVEYLNGPVTSTWGAQRAANGHPEPYGVKYIGIGNEEVLFHGDCAAEYDHYVERFNLLHDAMKAKDPSLALVCTAWWRPDSPSIERTFRGVDGKAAFWDLHVGGDRLDCGEETETELRRMQRMFRAWNPNTTLRVAIFEENGNTHGVRRALGHALNQNAVRRMGDFVLTTCAANALQPYGQNDNGWDQGQVFFTPSQVWGMPPYYAQQMSASCHQPLLVASDVEGVSGALDVTATCSEDGNTLVLHVVNRTDSALVTRLQIGGFGEALTARTVTLSGDPEAVNTPEEPRRIVPVEQVLKKTGDQICAFEPWSYTIVEFQK